MTLFTVCLALGPESHAISYESVAAALNDQGLAESIRAGASASVWSGGLRVTRDLTGWDALRSQLVANASTLLRPLLDYSPQGTKGT